MKMSLPLFFVLFPPQQTMKILEVALKNVKRQLPLVIINNNINKQHCGFLLNLINQPNHIVLII